jgi:predicted ATP-grasp superfamily ATP-dependent carboligase
MNHEPLVQNYIDDGTEFGYFSVFDDGEPLTMFQHRRIRSTNYFGGASAHREAVEIDELTNLGERILSHLEWTGPAMVEFRRDERDGEYKLMEINPRFWGSLPLGIAAGIDFPKIYYDLSRGRSNNSYQSYRKGTRASYLRAEIECLQSLLFDEYPDYVHKPSLLRTVREQLLTIPGSNLDLAQFDDVSPLVWDYIYAAKLLLNRI